MSERAAWRKHESKHEGDCGRVREQARERDRPVAYEAQKDESPDRNGKQKQERSGTPFHASRVQPGTDAWVLGCIPMFGFVVGVGRRRGDTSASFTATTPACLGRRTAPPRWSSSSRTAPGDSPATLTVCGPPLSSRTTRCPGPLTNNDTPLSLPISLNVDIFLVTKDSSWCQ